MEMNGGVVPKAGFAEIHAELPILKDPMQSEPLKDKLEPATKAFASMLMDEFVYFKSKRIMRFDSRWIEDTLFLRGQYPSNWAFTDSDSDVFMQRTAERTNTAYAKMLRLLMPAHGDAFNLSPSPIAGTKQDAANAGVDLAMKIIEDAHTATGYDKELRQGAWDAVSTGTAIFRAPRPKGGSFSRIPREADQQYPGIERLDPFQVYEDPAAEKIEGCGAIWVRHVLTEAQLLDLTDQGFSKEMIDGLVEEFPDGNYVPEQWETELGLNVQQKRFVIYERWGRISRRDQKLHKEKIPSLTDGVMEIWVAEGYILKAVADKFYNKILPFYVVPYQRQDHTMRGRGVPRQMNDLQVLMCANIRAIHDDMAWTSGHMTVIDRSQTIPGVDYTPRARKTYEIMSTEGSNRKPVDFFTIPSKMQDLVATMQFFESMLPTATNLPAIEDPRAAGSGMRTEGMQQAYFAVSEAFIQIVVGNFDEFFFTPMVRDYYEWAYLSGRFDGIPVDLHPVAKGVRGAIEREIIGQKAGQLMTMLANPNFQRIANEPGIMRMILKGWGMVGPDTVLPPEEAAAKAQVQAQQDSQAEQMRKQSEEKVRAETSRRDALLQLAKNVEDTNPAWGPAMELAYESLGAASPALYAGLALWAERMQRDLQGSVTHPELLETLTDMGPQTPLDMDPETRAHFQELRAQLDNVEKDTQLPPMNPGGPVDGLSPTMETQALPDIPEETAPEPDPAPAPAKRRRRRATVSRDDNGKPVIDIEDVDGE